MGYYTSQSRCLAYVYDQEHSNPSCYSHQKELGFTTKFLADLLLTAESTKDMEILDNLTKGHGQSYDQILVGNPEELTLSAAGSLVFYNRCLSIMYYKHGDEKCRQEAARMNDFLMRGEAPYSIDYSNKYNYAAIMMDTDEGVPKDIPLTQVIKEFITGSLGAFGRGVESEFIIWPVAINDLLYSINKDNVTPLSTEELKSIGPIRDTLSEAALSRMERGHLMEYTLNQRLEYYKTVMNSKFPVDKDVCAKDLRNIYYSYAEYVLDQTINLRVTDEENKMLGVLTELIKYYDSTFEIKCSLDEQNKKIQEAAQDYPVSFTVGKLGADMAIYAMFNFAAGAACAGGYEALGAGGRILAGTAADVLIKDLPRAVDTYAVTGDLGYTTVEFTKELVLDIGANAIGEAGEALLKSGSKAASEATDAKKSIEIEKLADAEHVAREAEAASKVAKAEGSISYKQADKVLHSDLLEKVGVTKEKLPTWAKNTGNYGYCDAYIDGLGSMQYFAHSSIQTEIPSVKGSGISIKPKSSPFKPLEVNSSNVINGEGAWLRDVDTEYKILSDIQSKLGNNPSITGKIQLYTELEPCPSCQNVISQFKEMYPNIDVEVLYSVSK